MTDELNELDRLMNLTGADKEGPEHPTTPEDDLEYVDPKGDRTDRLGDWVGGLYSPRNAGWYGPDLTPTQRFVGIVIAQMMASNAVASGTIDKLSDEVIFILGWAPFDVDALEAGEELANTDPEVRQIFDTFFGDGYNDYPGYEKYDLPKVPLGGSNKDEYGTRWKMALSGQWEQGGDFFMPPSSRDPQYRPGGLLVNVARRAENAMFGEPERTSAGLFDEAFTQGAGEGAVTPVIDNWAIGLANLGLDLYTVGRAAKVASAGAKGLSTAMQGIKGGQGFSQTIANGLANAGNFLQKANKVRRYYVGAEAAFSVSNTSFQYLQAYMGGPTEEWADIMSDYQRRKARAIAAKNVEFVKDPALELALSVQTSNADPNDPMALYGLTSIPDEGRTEYGAPRGTS